MRPGKTPCVCTAYLAKNFDRSLSGSAAGIPEYMPPVRRQDFVRKEMRMATLGNPGNTIAIIQKYQFVFQKKFGQNFLIDTHVLEKIIRAAEITDQDCVL